MALHRDSSVVFPTLRTKLLLCSCHVLHRFLFQIRFVARSNGLVFRWPHNSTVLNVLHAGRCRRGSHGFTLAGTFNRCCIVRRIATVNWHLVAAICGGLLELICVHFLHLNALSLLIRETVRRITSRLDR